MTETMNIEMNGLIRQSSVNLFQRIGQLFACASKTDSEDSLEQTILNRTDFLAVLPLLPEDSYEVNANQTIYSWKKSGKPIFIDESQYNYDVYWHQINVENNLYFCDKHQDLMYVLRVLFSEQTNCLIDRQQLQYVLRLLPQDFYDVNTNQTIYSFKLNGKPFFIDNDCYINIDKTDAESGPESRQRGEDVVEEVNCSIELGRKFAEMNRANFLKVINKEIIVENENGFKLFTDFNDNKLPQLSNQIISDELKLQLTPQNGQTKDQKKGSQKCVTKWNKELAKRRIYQKSELMIQKVSSEEAKNILSECKESLLKHKDRNQRRKEVSAKAKLEPVVKSDLFADQLYAISEETDSAIGSIDT